MLEHLAPFLIGAVVGWMFFYFIRKYEPFRPTTMIGTLAAIVSGAVIAFLLTMRDRFSVVDSHLCYFIGIGVSFFFYAIYILVINILFNHEKIKTKRLTVGLPLPGETDIQHLKRI